MDEVFRLWVYLSATPLLWLTATLASYVVADWISALLNRTPLANPVLLAVIILVVLLRLTHTAYRTYFDGAQFVHFMLGPGRWRWLCRWCERRGESGGCCSPCSPRCLPDQ